MVTIWENGTLEVGNDSHLTVLADTICNPRQMTLDIARHDGSITTIHGENIHNIVITMPEPNLNLNGAAVTGYGDPLILNESLTRWRWTDGEIGYGNTERDHRRSTLPSLRNPLVPGSRLQLREH